jgi:hypothetical protein
MNSWFVGLVLNTWAILRAICVSNLSGMKNKFVTLIFHYKQALLQFVPFWIIARALEYGVRGTFTCRKV